MEKNWEELHELVERGILVEVAHVKAHRTKKEKDNMTKIERFVTEGNEKADELAKAGAMYVALQYALVNKRRERMKYRTEWCAEVKRCR